MIQKYNDWFLPSNEELNAMLYNLIPFGVGGLKSSSVDYYWSSTENVVETVSKGQLSLYTGAAVGTQTKWVEYLVRPCRSFTSPTVYLLRDKGPAGGFIFYIDGEVYYECGAEDLGKHKWSNVASKCSLLPDADVFADTKGIGKGLINTAAIINQTGHLLSAASICKAYVSTAYISEILTETNQRCTPDEVKIILNDTTLSNDSIQSYIVTASTLVNTALGSGQTSVLKEIEKWLAAHLIAVTKERIATEEEAGGAKIKYAGSYGKGLQSTSYGQMVLTLDTTGRLASLMGKSAKVEAIKSFR